jgi:hypothetical protein
MKKVFFCLITGSRSLEVDYNLNPNFYLEISKKFKKFYMINISSCIYPNIKKKRLNKNFLKKIPKNIKLLNFNKYSDFKNYLYKRKNHDFIAFSAVGRTFKYFRIHHLLKKYNFKLFIVLNLGLIATTKHFHKLNSYQYFQKKLNEFIERRLSYLFYRLFILLNFFPKIEILFEASRIYKKIYDNYPSRKLNKIFPKLNLSVYKSIHHINSRSYDELYNKFNLSTEEEIVFLDSGFDHPDRPRRSEAATETERKKYYSMLESILSQLRMYFNKKIVVTVHPKTDVKIVKKYLKGFKLIKYKTRSHILKAFLVVFHESSSVLDAVFLKKNLIVLQSVTMGKYFEFRNKIHPNILGVPAYKMENFYKISKKDLIKDINKPKKKYIDYIKNYLVKDIRLYNLLNKKKEFEKNKNIILNQRGSSDVLEKINKTYF